MRRIYHPSWAAFHCLPRSKLKPELGLVTDLPYRDVLILGHSTVVPPSRPIHWATTNTAGETSYPDLSMPSSETSKADATASTAAARRPRVRKDAMSKAHAQTAHSSSGVEDKNLPGRSLALPGPEQRSHSRIDATSTTKANLQESAITLYDTVNLRLFLTKRAPPPFIRARSR